MCAVKASKAKLDSGAKTKLVTALDCFNVPSAIQVAFTGAAYEKSLQAKIDPESLTQRLGDR